MDTFFKDYSELYKWVSEGKPIKIGDKEEIYVNREFQGSLDLTLDSYSKVIEKDKITLYRYTYSDGKDLIRQSLWTNKSWNTRKRYNWILYKTETKTVEKDI